MASDARLVSGEGTAAALPPHLGRSWGLLVDADTPERHDPSSNTHGLSLQSYVFPPGFRATGYHSLNSKPTPVPGWGLTAGSCGAAQAGVRNFACPRSCHWPQRSIATLSADLQITSGGTSQAGNLLLHASLSGHHNDSAKNCHPFLSLDTFPELHFNQPWLLLTKHLNTYTTCKCKDLLCIHLLYYPGVCHAPGPGAGQLQGQKMSCSSPSTQEQVARAPQKVIAQPSLPSFHGRINST